MILVIDNYDSFVHNVTRYLRELGAEAEVKRNDALTADRIDDDVKGIVISPGPCTPHEAGVSLDVVRKLSGRLPILGICLGHQCIGEAFGGKVTRARRPMHGEASAIRHQGAGVLEGLPDGFNAGRYHSLIVERDEMPDCLEISASSPDGLVMGLRHRELPIEGVQFHPESILTEHGKQMLANFLRSGNS